MCRACRASWSDMASIRRACAGRTAPRWPCRLWSTTRKDRRRPSRWATRSTTACTSCRLPWTIKGTSRSSRCTSMGREPGIWRMFRIFDAAGIPVTFFGAAVALERNPAVAAKLALRGDEVAGHGYRWSNHYEMNLEEEREAIKRAIASIEKTTGARPLGWYCREMSVNTRRARRRGGRLPLRFRHLQRRSAVLDQGPRPHAPGRAVFARRQRRALHPGDRLRQPGTFL